MQLVGFDIYFYNEQAKIKKQLKTYLKEGVPKNQLKDFHFSKSEISALNWTKPNKEFKIGERFYDVVWRKNLETGKIYFQCVDDAQESQLFKNLAQYLDKNLGKQNHQSSLGFVFSVINTPLLLSEFHYEFAKPISDEKQQKISFYFQLLSEGYYSVTLPPPNIC